MWEGFDGTARTRDQTFDRINALNWTNWRPQGITLHNTAAPSLAQWAETGPSHDARIRNLQSYYEKELGWHAGPHWFVSRNFINWFSNPLLPGVHSRCFNKTRFGIEMVGDYSSEEFDTGDGALVRDNAVFLIAALNLKFGFSPEDLTFHKECKLDNHDCPGKKVDKGDIIQRVRATMATLKAPPPVVATATSLQRMLGITATVFGGEGDEQPVAYADVGPGWAERLGVALPARFAGSRPRVHIFANGKSALCDVVDVGPWFPSARGPQDTYWLTGARPRAESDSRTNRAGIDLTPAAANAIGLKGKGIVDWEFEMAASPTSVLSNVTTVPTIADLSKRIDRLEALLGDKAKTADTATQQDPLQPLLEQLLGFLKSKLPAPAPQPGPAPTDDIAKNIGAALKAILVGLNGGGNGTTPKGQLGPVNGALGDTIGNLLNGKKSGIGIIGALLSSVLPTLLPMITSNASILAPITAASGVGLPISLALAAWGVLGKMEKWSGNSATTGQAKS